MPPQAPHTVVPPSSGIIQTHNFRDIPIRFVYDSALNDDETKPSRGPGPPDLIAINGEDPTSIDFPISSYQINHVWGGAKGYATGNTPPLYRAKITLKRKVGEHLADLHFHDASVCVPENPKKEGEKDFKPPFNLNFPMPALDSVLHQLRFATTPVILFYYRPAKENQWAIGTQGDLFPPP